MRASVRKPFLLPPIPPGFPLSTPAHREDNQAQADPTVSQEFTTALSAVRIVRARTFGLLWPRRKSIRSAVQIEVTAMNRTRAQALIAALVLTLTAGASPPDSHEDEAERAVKAWGGTVIRDEARDGKPVIAVDLGRSQVVIDDGLRELRHFKSLQSLDLINANNVTDAGMKALKEFKDLRTLSVWNLRISDAGLQDLTEIRSLRSLDLTNTAVTDAGMKSLRELPNLEKLRLAGTGVTDEGLKQIKEIKILKLLDLTHMKISDAGMKELTDLPGLQTLILWATPVTDAGAKELGVFTSLREINLSDTRITNAGMTGLKGLTNLETLDLLRTRVTAAGVEQLLDLKKLRTLELPTETLITDRILRGLREAGTLHALTQADGRELLLTGGQDGVRPSGPDSVISLELSNTRVTDEGLKALKGLDNLRELGLNHKKVTDEGLKELRELTNLRSLSLDECPGVTDAGMKELAGLKDLRRLSLTFTRVKGPGLRDLKGLKQLQTVQYSRDAVTDEILRNMREAGMLHQLSVAHGHIGTMPSGPDGIEALDLYFSRGVTDAGLKEIKAYRNLQFLFLLVTQQCCTAGRDSHSAIDQT